MKKFSATFLMFLAVVLSSQTAEAQTSTEKSDYVIVEEPYNLRDAFLNIPDHYLDLLDRDMRSELLKKYEKDSVAQVTNTMYGLSRIIPPVTSDYLNVQITPVTTFTLKLLKYKGKPIAMTIYTIGDTLQASDSDVKFFEFITDDYLRVKEMKELKREKFLPLVSTPAFFNLKDLDSKARKEILQDIPFPTVEYIVSPDSDVLTERLTVGEFLSKEVLERITPYIVREHKLVWNGKNFKPEE